MSSPRFPRWLYRNFYDFVIGANIIHNFRLRRPISYLNYSRFPATQASIRFLTYNKFSSCALQISLQLIDWRQFEDHIYTSLTNLSCPQPQVDVKVVKCNRCIDVEMKAWNLNSTSETIAAHVLAESARLFSTLGDYNTEPLFSILDTKYNLPAVLISPRSSRCGATDRGLVPQARESGLMASVVSYLYSSKMTLFA